MTVVPTRPLNLAVGATAAADADVYTIDGASGVRRITHAALRAQLVGGITGALVYRGTVAGASVPSTSSASGDYYIVTSAGSSQGKAWNVGDLAIYRGTSGVWDQVPAGRQVNVKDFGAVGDGVANDSAAIQSAVDAITAGGGEVFFPPGTYLCDDVELDSRVRLRGASRDSVTLKMTAAGFYIVSINSGTAGTSNPAQNKFGVQLTGITFTGRVVEDGFFEFKYLVNLNAISDFTISDCAFTAFQGDGIYIGSGNEAGLERHNFNGVIERCNFDGVNNTNRNAISAIDITGLRIRDCFFDRCSKSDMPGCFDAEPDASYGVVRDVEISGCRVKRCNGQIIFGANMHASSNFYGFSVHDNFFENDNGSLTTAVAVITGVTIDATTPAMGVSISGNRFECPFAGILLYNVSGADIADNVCRNSGPFLLAEYSGTKCLRNAKISRNRAVNSGSFAGWAICGKLDGVLFEGNEIDAPPNNDASAFIAFLGAHASTSVSFTGNRFRKGPSTVTKTVYVDVGGGHTFTQSLNKWVQNTTDVPLANDFPYSTQEFRELDLFSYDTTKLPDAFTLTREESVVNGDSALPSRFKQGLLITYRFIDNGDAGFRPFIIQLFYPANNPINSMPQGQPGFYYRHPINSGNSWDKWYAASDRPIETKSADYTLAGYDHTIIFLTTGWTATLPDAALHYGKELRIVNGSGSGNITVVSFDGVQTINFTASATLTPTQAMTVISDKTRWWIVSRG